MQIVRAVRREHREPVAGRAAGPWSTPRLSRNRSRSRDDWSAQCRSSRTSSSGATSVTSASSPAMPSKSRSRPPASRSPSSAPPPSSRPMTGCAASTSVNRSSALSTPRISVNGRYGRPTSPRSTQCPVSTVIPLSEARPAASASTRVFPTPASPAMSTARASRTRARSSTPARRVSSSSRPMSGVVKRFCGTVESCHAPLTALAGQGSAQRLRPVRRDASGGAGCGLVGRVAGRGSEGGPGSYSSDVSKFQNQPSPGS